VYERIAGGGCASLTQTFGRKQLLTYKSEGFEMILTFFIFNNWNAVFPRFYEADLSYFKMQLGCGKQCSQYYCCACFEEEEKEGKKKAISEFSERGEFDVQKTI
jgi:hypothetical protein